MTKDHGPAAISASDDRFNQHVFAVTYVLLLLAAPVTYIGILQAAICNRLGAGAFLSNLPASGFLLGAAVPLIIAWTVPSRQDKAMATGAYLASAVSIALVAVTLGFEAPRSVILSAILLQGLAQGVSANIALVYTYQCLGRGTSEVGRARAVRLGLTLGPIAAVVGSLATQVAISQRFSSLTFPRDFALIYSLAIPCVAGAAWNTHRYRLPAVAAIPRSTLSEFAKQIASGIQSEHIRLCAAFALWNCVTSTIPNLALYFKTALGHDPRDFSGLMLALRFGCKCAAGLLLGSLAIRRGFRPAAALTVALAGFAVSWAWTVPGLWYLGCFGLMGAGELGGAYFPNVMISISPQPSTTRHLSLLTLMTVVGSIATAAHGALADRFGFPASFLFGIMAAALSLVLLFTSSSKQSQAG